MNKKRSLFTLLQATQNDPGLARLMALQKGSQDRLHAILQLIPASLRPSVQCGPLEDGIWCLLLANTTTAAKMRQLVPTFEAHLRVSGLEVKSIRLKVKRQ
nr:hypothetical protein [Rhodoferax sp.]